MTLAIFCSLAGLPTFIENKSSSTYSIIFLLLFWRYNPISLSKNISYYVCRFGMIYDMNITKIYDEDIWLSVTLRQLYKISNALDVHITSGEGDEDEKEISNIIHNFLLKQEQWHYYENGKHLT